MPEFPESYQAEEQHTWQKAKPPIDPYEYISTPESRRFRAIAWRVLAAFLLVFWGSVAAGTKMAGMW